LLDLVLTSPRGLHSRATKWWAFRRVWLSAHCLIEKSVASISILSKQSRQLAISASTDTGFCPRSFWRLYSILPQQKLFKKELK